jgi:hypothetical protein
MLFDQLRNRFPTFKHISSLIRDVDWTFDLIQNFQKESTLKWVSVPQVQTVDFRLDIILISH